jgi:hypothetical protein
MPEVFIEVMLVLAKVNFLEKEVILPALSTRERVTLPVESGTVVRIETLELMIASVLTFPNVTYEILDRFVPVITIGVFFVPDRGTTDEMVVV